MISRLDSMVGNSDQTGGGTPRLESCTCLGLDTLVGRGDPEDDVDLTCLGTADGDAGDTVIGPNRFGEVVDQKWTTGTDGGSGTVKDEYKYTYDADGNVLSKTNVAADNASHYEFDENYTYNQLSELTAVSRGTDSSYQSFSMNGLGDIESSTTNGVVQNRSTNDDNQVYAINSATPNIAYESNGNMTTDDQGRTLIWDAWNRLVGVENSSGQLDCDSTRTMGWGGWRAKAPLIRPPLPQAPRTSITAAAKAVEERTGVTDANGDNLSSNGTVTLTNVFSPADGNILLRDNYASGSFSSRIYFTHDMLGSVTAVLNASGGVLQREVFDSYGNAEFLAANFSPQGSDNYNLGFLWQDGRRDQTTQDYLFGARWYSPTAQVWLSWDPENYVNGPDAYINRADNPINREDPTGLKTIVVAFGGLGGNGPIDPYWKNAVMKANANAEYDEYEWTQAAKAYKDTIDELKAKVPLTPAFAKLPADGPFARPDCLRNTIVVLGHSFGGNAAYDYINLLKGQGIGVDEVVTADPRHPPGLPPGDTAALQRAAKCFLLGELF